MIRNIRVPKTMKNAARLFSSTFRRVPRPSCFNWAHNGDDWGKDFPTCKDGCKQSPIDLPGKAPILSSQLEIKLQKYEDIEYPAQIQKGYGWLGADVKSGEMEVTFPDGNTITYVPLNFHFHAPSDHTIYGRHYDLEMHIVHVEKYSRALGAVLGIMFDTVKGGDKTNPFIQSLSTELANDPDLFVIVDQTYQTGYYEAEQSVRLSKFIKSLDLSEFFYYEGSLTTPPCTEGIKWLPLKNVQPISKDQLRNFTQMWAEDSDFAQGRGNNRNIQPTQDRLIYQK